jgi:hypothetical protein
LSIHIIGRRSQAVRLPRFEVFVSGAMDTGSQVLAAAQQRRREQPERRFEVDVVTIDFVRDEQPIRCCHHQSCQRTHASFVHSAFEKCLVRCDGLPVRLLALLFLQAGIVCRDTFHVLP